MLSQVRGRTPYGYRNESLRRSERPAVTGDLLRQAQGGLDDPFERPHLRHDSNAGQADGQGPLLGNGNAVRLSH